MTQREQKVMKDWEEKEEARVWENRFGYTTSRSRKIRIREGVSKGDRRTDIYFGPIGNSCVEGYTDGVRLQENREGRGV